MYTNESGNLELIEYIVPTFWVYNNCRNEKKCILKLKVPMPAVEAYKVCTLLFLSTDDYFNGIIESKISEIFSHCYCYTYEGWCKLLHPILCEVHADVCTKYIYESVITTEDYE